jgi:hypothetical protein
VVKEQGSAGLGLDAHRAAGRAAGKERGLAAGKVVVQVDDEAEQGPLSQSEVVPGVIVGQEGLAGIVAVDPPLRVQEAAIGGQGPGVADRAQVNSGQQRRQAALQLRGQLGARLEQGARVVADGRAAAPAALGLEPDRFGGADELLALGGGEQGVDKERLGDAVDGSRLRGAAGVDRGVVAAGDAPAYTAALATASRRDSRRLRRPAASG